MNKIYFFLISIACFTSYIQAQSWTPIKYGEVYNYQFSDSQTISHTIWIDSIAMQSGNYLSYLHKAVSSPCGQAASPFCHVYYQTPQFLQRKCIRKSDSLFILQNPETYYIRPLAAIGETWTFDSLLQITATVSAIDTQTVFNALDTLKTITLSNGEIIKLSHNWGVFTFPRVGTGKSFQLVGIQSQKLGQIMPTYKDIYDFEVGDVFCYETKYDNYSSFIQSTTYYVYTKNRILEKQVFTNSVKYKMEFQQMKKELYPYAITHYPIQISYVIYPQNSPENDFLTNYIPNTFYLNQGFFPNGIEGIKAISKRNGKTSLFSTAHSISDMPYYQYANVDTIEAFTSGEYGHIETYHFTTTLGLVAQMTKDFGMDMNGNPTSNTSTSTLTSYIKGQDTIGEICPDWLFTATEIPFSGKSHLYPNPASDRLFLYYNNPQYKNFVFAITDLTGREVVPNTPLQSSTTYEIVVRDWAKGMYFVRVFDTEGQNVYTEKFVKE